MNPFIWCAVGAVIGWFSGGFATANLSVLRIESILVGIFGAFIGAEVIGVQFAGSPAVAAAPAALGSAVPAVLAAPFTILGFVFAVGGAITMLVLLRLMRKAVGPMRPGKSRSTERR